MNDLDLDGRLERLADMAARDATVPDLEAVARRGRRWRRRRLAGSALLAAVVAAGLLLPARLAGRSAPPADWAPAIDTGGASGYGG
jgi:ferric-dicitrate binding protein FerR (iron transport regulator)